MPEDIERRNCLKNHTAPQWEPNLGLRNAHVAPSHIVNPDMTRRVA